MRRPGNARCKVSNVGGTIRTTQLSGRQAKRSTSAAEPRCTAEHIDRILQDLGCTSRHARQVRATFIRILTDAILKEGLVWTPAGYLIVEMPPPIKRFRRPFETLRIGRDGQLRIVRTIYHYRRLKFEVAPSLAPRPKAKEYTYKQYGLALHSGHIELPPPPCTQPAPLVAALRPHEGWERFQKSKRRIKQRGPSMPPE